MESKKCQVCANNVLMWHNLIGVAKYGLGRVPNVGVRIINKILDAKACYVFFFIPCSSRLHLFYTNRSHTMQPGSIASFKVLFLVGAWRHIASEDSKRVNRISDGSIGCSMIFGIW